MDERNGMYEDYVPEYPSIHEEDFYRRLVEKKEFWTDESEIFFRHQINIARYLSQWTLFDSLLVYHEMGTGKSGVTVALSENLRGMYKRVIYITHNETQIQNYKNEILKFSPRLAAALAREEIKDQDRRRMRWNKILANDGYEFYTMGTIYSEFNKRMQMVKERYDYSIIIVDEAHHLVQTNKEEDKRSYETLVALLDEIEHKKCLIMTGTPVRDQIDEIVPLLNLVLQQKLDRSSFIHDFFSVSDNIKVLDDIALPIYEWKDGAKKRFQDFIRGRISYLRREMTNIDIRYIGRVCPPMKSLILAVNPMLPGSIQNSVYLDVFEKEVGGDKKKACFYSKSKQASLFVFPDQTIGDKAFQKYVSPNYTMRSEFIRLLGPNIDLIPADVKLEFLSQFSITYASVIREIINHPQELVYVFSDLVEQSGILLFMSLLKSLFGYQLVRSTNDISYTPGARMILLNDQVAHENSFQDLIAYFNDPANKNGQLCQIILSTNKTKEGISLMNIQQIHIMTPSWNMSDISQAMARGLRARSHIELTDPHIRIFLHAAIPFIPTDETEEEWTELKRDNQQTEFFYSIDYQRYYRSEIKEKNAKLLERVFLESSWDCMMNMDINTKTGRFIDDSRECEYDKCEYKCEGIGDEQQSATDISNWRIFYSTLSLDQTLDRVRQAFREQSIYTLKELKDKIDSDLLEECIRYIMMIPLIIIDKNGMKRFMSVHNDIVFLIDNPCLPGRTNEHYYYQQHPATEIEYSVHDILDAYYLQNMNRLLPRLIRMIYADHVNAKIYFESFPLELQRLFCEICIENEILHPEKIRSGFREWFLNNFKTDINYVPGILFEHRFVKDKKQPRRLHIARGSWA